jgi:uncharacterized surface protein with fasciclin (FAS1) repeats
MARYFALYVLLVACICRVQAQKHLNEALAQNNHALFAKIVECAGATKAFDGTKGKVTVLAPTDAAIVSFLSSMGLSAGDVLGQEELCDTLLRYHVLPYELKSGMIVKKDSKAQTLEPNSYLLFNKDSSGVTVKDMQGNVAKVSKGDIPAGEATLHSVDRVLMSGSVFTSIASALKYHSKKHTELVKALTTAGLMSAVTDPKAPFTGTILAPTDAAFKKLTITPSKAQLKDILLYHVLKDVVVLPTDHKSGTKYATLLPGHTVQIKLSQGTIKNQFGQTETVTFADVVPEAGKPARMRKSNIFAGKGVIHGIDTVLIPKAAVVTEKAMMKPMGRKLLQGGDRGTDFDFRQQGAMEDTAGAIAAAASGQSSAGAATAVGSASAYNVGMFNGY